MKRSNKFIGIVVIILAILLMVSWEKWGRDKLFSQKIPVLNHNVEKGEIIKEKDIRLVNINWGENCLKKDEENLIVGKEATSFIHKNMPLFKEDFQDPNTVADIDKGIYLMPLSKAIMSNDWGKVKKGDKVVFYYGDTKVVQATVASVDGEEKKMEVTTDEQGVRDISKIIYNGGKLTVVRG